MLCCWSALQSQCATNNTAFPASCAPARVGVTLHNDALDLCHTAVVQSGHGGAIHERNANSNSLTLGRHQHHLVINVNAALIPARHAWHQRIARVCLTSINNACVHRTLHNTAVVVAC